MDIYQGNHQEIGEQIGAFYLSQNTHISSADIDHVLLKKQLELYKKHYPNKLDELKATAKAANFNETDFLYNNLCTGIKWHQSLTEPQKGCTIFGVQNESGAYVGRNYDWKPGTENYFKVLKCLNSNDYDYIGITDMDFFHITDAKKHHLFYETEDAINNQGLYIGLTFAYHNDTGFGLSPIHMIQLIAETCKTVEEALAVFQRTPLSVPKNFFIADKFGNMVAIEHTATKHKIIEPLNGILVKTNHFLNEELAKEDTVLKHNELSTTFKRYAEALEKLTLHKEDVHQIGIEKILKDPSLEILENNRKMKTIWSLAIDLKNQKYRLYWNFFDQLKEEKLEF